MMSKNSFLVSATLLQGKEDTDQRCIHADRNVVSKADFSPRRYCISFHRGKQ